MKMKLCFLIIPRLLNPNVPTDIVKSISESSNWEHLNIWAQDSCNFGLSIAQYYLVLISPVVNLQGTFFCWKVGSVPKIYDIYCLSTRAKDMGNGIAMCTRPEKQKRAILSLHSVRCMHAVIQKFATIHFGISKKSKVFDVRCQKLSPKCKS